MCLKCLGKMLFIVLALMVVRTETSFSQRRNSNTKQKKVMAEEKKLIIYQLLPRLFGNKKTDNIPYGTIEQNGSGKFDDISVQALDAIKDLGANYVWYTGVLAHGSLTDYSSYGIQKDSPEVIKGRAGSPYAVRDYYDVDPDLAVNVNNRMQEFENLIKRTHAQGLKMIMDFVPNHVARSYHSTAMPKGVEDFGATDDVHKSFSPNNDFYYVPGRALVAPENPDKEFTSLMNPEGLKYTEDPAKATGNDVFNEHPSINDWYETIKLNYGLDYLDNRKQYFTPRPPVWTKMRDILLYWAGKGTDGFRCDMAEMVPVEFWNWVIPEIKNAYPNLIFIGEAYDSRTYHTYLTTGKFDYLYDKVGLYDGLKRLIRNESWADVKDIRHVWQVESAGFGDHMLRFLENHDEERIASKGFAENPLYALPAMVVSATLSGGPVMIYFGQEVGEPAKGKEGYGGDDSRTTIFDYWGVPEHQKWMNNGAFDGGLLSEEQQTLRAFYKTLMHITAGSEAIKQGALSELNPSGNMNNRMYGFFRFTEHQRLLILVNFDRETTLKADLPIPEEVRKHNNISGAKNLLNNTPLDVNNNTLKVEVPPSSSMIIEF
jgi:glycosidase